jgi:hypothetical protein
MPICFEGGSDRVDRLDVVEVGESIRRDGFWFLTLIVLDIGKNGNLPISFQALTGGLFFIAWQHVSLLV